MDRIAELRLKGIIANRAFRASQTPEVCGEFGNRAEICRVQTDRLRQMVSFAINNSPFYRKYYGDHGLTNRIPESVDELPILTKELLMENFDEIVTVPGITRNLVDDFVARGESWIYDGQYMFIKSTGTSGYHTLNVLTIDELATISALIKRRSMAETRQMTRAAFLFGRDPSHLSYKFSCINIPYLSEARHIPTQNGIDIINDQLMSFNPNVISSFPSTLSVVIDQVKAGRLSLMNGITVLSSGEMLEESLIAEFQKHLGTIPYDIYTCIEAGPIAQDCREHHLHINEDWFVVESSPSGGIITNLLNRTVPILRFRFDDLLSIDTGTCSCGSPLRRLNISDAKRTGQFYIQDKLGHKKKVNTMIFKDVIYKFPAIVQSQIQQVSPRTFVVRAFSPTATEQLRINILAAINQDLRAADIREDELDVELEFVQPSQMSFENGKIRHFVPWLWADQALKEGAHTAHRGETDHVTHGEGAYDLAAGGDRDNVR